RSDGDSGGVGLGLPRVAGAEEDGAREIGGLDGVEIDDEDAAPAKEREVLEDLVAKRAGADDEDLRGRQFLLPPPGDQTEPAVPICVINDENVIVHRSDYGLWIVDFG